MMESPIPTDTILNHLVAFNQEKKQSRGQRQQIRYILKLAEKRGFEQAKTLFHDLENEPMSYELIKKWHQKLREFVSNSEMSSILDHRLFE